MGVGIHVDHKSEALCIKLRALLEYDNPTDMEQTTENSMTREIWIFDLLGRI